MDDQKSRKDKPKGKSPKNNDPKGTEPKRNNEGKSSSTVWFALILVGTLAVALFLLLSQNQKTLKYGDFKNLLEITKYDQQNCNVLVPGSESACVWTVTEPGPEGREIE